MPKFVLDRLSCCRDGSFAVIQPLSVQQTAEESSSSGSVHPHLVGNVHASVGASDIEKNVAPQLVPCWSVVMAASETGVSTKYMGPSELLERIQNDFAPQLVPFHSMLVGRDRSLRNGCVYQDKSAMGRSSWTSAGFSGSTSSRPVQVWKYGKDTLEVRLPCRSNIVQDTSQWSQQRSGATPQKVSACIAELIRSASCANPSECTL